MAKASKVTELRQVTKTEEVQVIHLHLSTEEADTLLALTSRVGGDPALSPRRHVNQVANALVNVLGYGTTSTTAGKYTNSSSGIYFDNDKAPKAPEVEW